MDDVSLNIMLIIAGGIVFGAVFIMLGTLLAEAVWGVLWLVGRGVRSLFRPPKHMGSYAPPQSQWSPRQQRKAAGRKRWG